MGHVEFLCFLKLSSWFLRLILFPLMFSLTLLSLPFPTLNVHVTQKRWRYLIYLNPRIKLKTIVGTEIRSIQQTKIQCLADDEKLPGRKISRKVQAIKLRKISHQNQPQNDINGKFKRQGHFNSYHHHYILFTKKLEENWACYV